MKNEIEKLVKHVAVKAVEEKTPFPEAIDALKAVTAYLTMEQKKKEPPEPEDGEEPSFDNFKGALTGAEGRDNGSTSAVRSHRRS